MLLSQLIGKRIVCNATYRGTVLGVGVCLKNGAVKYLLCTNANNPSLRNPHTDFAIAFSTVLSVGEDVTISKLRTLYPKSCAKLFLRRPVYTAEGGYLGEVEDLQMENFTIEKLILDDNTVYQFGAITAISDAVIIKKAPPYPIGQRIPAPLSMEISKKESATVSRALLKKAVEQGRLIELTLSLAPFRS